MNTLYTSTLFVTFVWGLLHGNNHPATTSSPDGTVLHQTLGLLVVELDKRVNDLQNKVAAMESERHQYVEKTTQLEKALTAERLRVESLQQVLDGYNVSLTSILSENSLQKNATMLLNSTVSSLIFEHEDLRSNVEYMKNVSMSLMEKDISNMNHQIRRILSFEVSLSGNLSHVQNVIHDLNANLNRDKPGFTAYLDGSFQDDGTIILPHVYSNIGSVYNPTIGIFTEDQSGEYAFYLGVECIGSGQKIIDLLKDGSMVAHTACLPDNGTSFYGSTFVVLHIEKGSKIWITNSRHEHVGLRGKTTLSGFLLSN